MPAFSVSCSPEQAVKMHAKGISGSKAFQLGIEIYDQAGGVDVFLRMKEENKKLQEKFETLEELNAEWRRKYTLVKKELDAFQIVYERQSVLEEAARKEAERVDTLLREGGA